MAMLNNQMVNEEQLYWINMTGEIGYGMLWVQTGEPIWLKSAFKIGNVGVTTHFFHHFWDERMIFLGRDNDLPVISSWNDGNMWWDEKNGIRSGHEAPRS
jgi:hypothetical protein